MNLSEWILASSAVFLGSLITAVTGFGFGLVIVTLLILIYNPHTAVIISFILTIPFSIILLSFTWNRVRCSLVARLLFGSLFGIPLGVFIYAAADVRLMKIMISAVVVVFSALLLVGFRRRITNDRLGAVVAGFLAGVFSSSISMGAPPLVLLLVNQGYSKDVFRASLTAHFLCVTIISLLVLFTGGLVPPGSFPTAVRLLPALISGLAMGNWLFHHVPVRLFDQIVLLLLIALGSVSLVLGVFGTAA